MLQKQTPILDELRKLIPSRAVDILLQILGNSIAEISHGGPVIIPGFPGNRPANWPQQGNLQINQNAIIKIIGAAWGTAKWCRTTAAWTTKTSGQSGKTQYWVLARTCDSTGRKMTGGAFDLRLVCTGGHQPVLDKGDVLCYWYDVDGTKIGIPNCEAPPYEYPYEYSVSSVARTFDPDALVRLA